MRPDDDDRAAVAEEREACARVIDAYRYELCGERWSLEALALRQAAALVRARGLCRMNRSFTARGRS